MKLKTDGTQFHEEMSRDIDGFYPWQYKDYDVNSVTLIPIEPDIQLYWNEPSIFRKGYSVNHEDKIINIPNFLLKINGRHKNNNEYIEFIRFLTSAKNTVVYSHIPYYSSNFSAKAKDSSIKLTDYINELEYIDKNNKESLLYQYLKYLINNKKIIERTNFDGLVREKQIQIIKVLESMINKDINNMTISLFENLFSICLNIPEDIIVLINNFDYGSDIPKVVFENCSFTENNGFLVLLLSKLGFDIIVLETSGAATIEKYLSMDSISLGYFEKNYDIKEKSMTKKEKVIKNIKNIDTYTLFPTLYYIYMVGSIGLIILFMFIGSGLFNTIFQISTIVILILLSFLLSKYDYIDLERDASGVFVTIYTVGIVMLLIGRGITSIEPSTYSAETVTYTGTLNISDSILETKNNYTMQVKKDAVVLFNNNKLYMYLDNNEKNDISIFFKIKIGSSTVYESSCIEPYEYIKYVELSKSCRSDIEDANVVIEYYEYDPVNGKKYTMLGSQEIKIHVANTNEELKELLKEYNLE